jgi:hypothetical protein
MPMLFPWSSQSIPVAETALTQWLLQRSQTIMNLTLHRTQMIDLHSDRWPLYGDADRGYPKHSTSSSHFKLWGNNAKDSPLLLPQSYRISVSTMRVRRVKCPVWGCYKDDRLGLSRQTLFANQNSRLWRWWLRELVSFWMWRSDGGDYEN